jgi:hypothetical protein
MRALKYFSDVHRWPVLLCCVNQRMTHLQRMLQLELGTAQLKQFDDAITSDVLNIMGVLQGHRDVDLVNTVHELRALPLGLGGAAMRRNSHGSAGPSEQTHEPVCVEQVRVYSHRQRALSQTRRNSEHVAVSAVCPCSPSCFPPFRNCSCPGLAIWTPGRRRSCAAPRAAFRLAWLPWPACRRQRRCFLCGRSTAAVAPRLGRPPSTPPHTGHAARPSASGSWTQPSLGDLPHI